MGQGVVAERLLFVDLGVKSILGSPRSVTFISVLLRSFQDHLTDELIQIHPKPRRTGPTGKLQLASR